MHKKASSRDVNGQSFRKLKKVETTPDPDIYDITYVDISPSEGTSSPLSKSPWSVQVDPTAVDSPYHSSKATTEATTDKSNNYSPNVLMGSLVREEGHIYSLATSGDLLYTGSDSKNIRVWKNHVEFSSFKSNSGLVKAIVLAGDKIFTGHQDGKIRVWKVSSKESNVHRRVGTMPNLLDYIRNSIAPSSYFNFTRRNRSSAALGFRHLDAISCLALSEDKRLLYSGSWDKTFKVWRVSDFRCLESVNAHEDAVNAVVSGFDGLVFTGSADGTVKVWRREDQAKETKHFFSQTLLKQDCAVTAIAVDQSATLVYCGSSDGTVNFWERENNMRNGGVLKGHKLAVLCLVAAGNLMFSGSADLGIRVWRRPEGGCGGGGEHVCLSVLTGHAGPVKCLAVERDQESASGERRWIVYSGSLDRSVKMWRVSERSPPMGNQEFRLPDQFGGGPSELTVAPSFSAQGRISPKKYQKSYLCNLFFVKKTPKTKIKIKKPLHGNEERYICLLPIVVFFFFGSRFSTVASAGDQNALAASFVFGDSLVDAGNNYLQTLSRANSPPNGLDFNPSRGNPTGRFTNGRTIADIVGEKLGQPSYAVPYLAPNASGEAILKGVNYASGGGGILNAIGSVFVNRLGMDIQVDFFSITRKQFDKLLGEDKARDYIIKRSIFSIVIGSNDFLNNYLVPFVAAQARLTQTPEIFVEDMISHLRNQLKLRSDVYHTKKSINQLKDKQCVDLANKLALQYNARLKDFLLVELKDSLKDAHFVYANVYDLVMDLIVNFKDYGFKTASEACCGTGGRLAGILPCGPTSSLCTDRSKHVFWDPYHPSETANLLIADKLLYGNSKFVTPFNLLHLRDL